MRHLRLILSLIVLLTPALGAQESTVPLPVITGVTTVLATYAPGYLNASDTGVRESLRFNFFIYVANLDAVWSSVTTIRVHLGTLYWTIDKDKYANRSKGYLGGWGSWSLSDSYAQMTPLDLKVSIKLSDGRTVEKPFRVFPEEASTAGRRFLVPASFVGGDSPYHWRAPEAARVSSLSLQGSDVVIDFIVPDLRTTTVTFRLYSEEGTRIGSTDQLTVGKDGPGWLNEGRPIVAGGVVNRARIPLALFRPDGKNAVSSVNLTTWTEVDPETNLLRSSYLLYQEGTRYSFTPPEGEALIWHRAYRDLQEKARRTPTPTPAWNEENRQAWLLGLGGILGQLNDETFGELSPMKKTTANQNRVDAMLTSSWSVSSRESLIEAMQTLIDFGHRSRFAKQLQMIRDNPLATDQDLAVMVSSEQRWPESQFAFVRQFQHVVGDRGLLAWDFCRLVMLARDGFLLGYLTEDEAWTWIGGAGERLRNAYDSWVDLGDGFLLGRMYFAGPDRASELYVAGRNAMQELLLPDGIWSKVPWPPRPSAEVDFLPAGLGASR